MFLSPDLSVHSRRCAACAVSIICLLALSLSPADAAAQELPPELAPAPPPESWTGSISAGLALTSGNTDTSTFNAAIGLEHDTGERMFFQATGLYLRGEKDDELTVDKTAVELRSDYRLSPRLSVFGQASYLRDRFKEIDYLVAPTVGLGYQVTQAPRAEFGIDASLGVVVEHNTGRAVRTDGAIAASEKLAFQVSDTARLTHSLSGLWKVANFGDALYTLTAGIAASVTENSELKAELQNTYKSEPPDPVLEKNDVSVLLSFVYKF